jgi:hypothetical protein
MLSEIIHLVKRLVSMVYSPNLNHYFGEVENKSFYAFFPNSLTKIIKKK